MASPYDALIQQPRSVVPPAGSNPYEAIVSKPRGNPIADYLRGQWKYLVSPTESELLPGVAPGKKFTVPGAVELAVKTIPEMTALGIMTGSPGPGGTAALSSATERALMGLRAVRAGERAVPAAAVAAPKPGGPLPATAPKPPAIKMPQGTTINPKIAKPGGLLEVAPPLSEAPPVTASSAGQASGHWFSQPRTYLSRQGAGGRAIVQMEQDARRATMQADRALDGAVRKLPALNPAEEANLAAVMRGESQPATQNVVKWYQTFKPKVDSNPARIQQAGLHSFDKEAKQYIEFTGRGNYHPVIPDWAKIDALAKKNPLKYAELLDQIAENQGLANRKAAEMWLRQVRLEARGERLAGFQHQRVGQFPEELQVKPSEALVQHQRSVERRLIEAGVYGPGEENLAAAAARVGAEGGDEAFAREATLRISHHVPPPPTGPQGVANFLTNAAVLTSMGPFSTVRQGSQILNTMRFTGAKALGQAFKFARTAEGKALADEIAAVVNPADVARTLGAPAENVTGRVLKAYGFTQMDMKWRDISGIAGNFWGKQLIKDIAAGGKKAATARSWFQRAGINVDMALATKNPAAVEKATNDLGWWVAQEAQFGAGPLSQPFWSNTPWGRMLTILRKFTYYQTAYTYKHLIQAAKSDPARVAQTLAAMTAAGEVSQDIILSATGAVKALAQGRVPSYEDLRKELAKRPNDPTLRLIENFISGSGGTLLTALVTSMKYARDQQDAERILYEQLGGVVPTKAFRLGAAGYQTGKRLVTGKDEPYRPIVREAPKVLLPSPFGPELSERFAPPIEPIVRPRMPRVPGKRR